MNTDTLYLVQWGSSSAGNSHSKLSQSSLLRNQTTALKWRDDKFMIPSPLSEALDLLNSVSKFCKLPSARLVPTNDDADLIPLVFKRNPDR